MRKPSSFVVVLVSIGASVLAAALLAFEFVVSETLAFGGTTVATRTVSAAAIAVALGATAVSQWDGNRRGTLFWSLWAVGIPVSIANWRFAWVGTAAVFAALAVQFELDRRLLGDGTVADEPGE